MAQLREIIDTHISKPDSSATERVSNILNEVQTWSTATVKKSKLKHNKTRNRLTKELEKLNAKLGTDHTHRQLPPNTPAHLLRILTHRQKTVQNELIQLYAREQEIYCHNFSIQKDAFGESCWRGLFDAIRPPKQQTIITALRDPNITAQRRGHRPPKIISQKELNAHADRFYGAPGGLFNLGLSRDSEAEATLLAALAQDGKTLPDEAKPKLSQDSILDPFHISRTIRGMPNHSTPGIDGFPWEFFKIFAGTDGVDTQTDTNGKTTKTPIANSFATLLSHAFREMLLTGTMTPNMRTGIVSLLYKDKGPAMICDTTDPSPSSVHSIKFYPEPWPSASEKSFTTSSTLSKQPSNQANALAT